jgi:hypothetical protein
MRLHLGWSEIGDNKQLSHFKQYSIVSQIVNIRKISHRYVQISTSTGAECVDSEIHLRKNEMPGDIRVMIFIFFS